MVLFSYSSGHLVVTFSCTNDLVSLSPWKLRWDPHSSMELEDQKHEKTLELHSLPLFVYMKSSHLFICYCANMQEGLELESEKLCRHICILSSHPLTLLISYANCIRDKGAEYPERKMAAGWSSLRPGAPSALQHSAMIECPTPTPTAPTPALEHPRTGAPLH